MNQRGSRLDIWLTILTNREIAEIMFCHFVPDILTNRVCLIIGAVQNRFSQSLTIRYRAQVHASFLALECIDHIRFICIHIGPRMSNCTICFLSLSINRPSFVTLNHREWPCAIGPFQAPCQRPPLRTTAPSASWRSAAHVG